METFRCRWGKVWLYIEGEPVGQLEAMVPRGSEAYYTVFDGVELLPCQQYTILPKTLHWFRSGPGGAIISKFSSTSTDENDSFTDPHTKRMPEIKEDRTIWNLRDDGIGVRQATMVQNPFQKGCLEIQTAVDASLGKSVQKSADTGLTVVTKANMDTVK